MDILKKIFSIFLRVSISIILLAFLFGQIDKRALFETIKNSNKPLLLFAFAVFSFNYSLCFYRWRMLLRTAKISLPVKRVIISYSGGVFFSLFLPSTIGGDLIRSLDLAVYTKKPKEVVATVLLDRLSGYVGLVLLVMLAMLFGWNLVHHPSVWISVTIITAILIGTLLVLFNNFLYSKINKFLDSPKAGRIREVIKNLHQEIYYFRDHKKMIFYNLVLSLLIQAVFPLTFYFIALALGVRLNMLYFFVLLPIIGAITLLPISIGGLGLRDVTTIFFFAKIGVAKDLAFAMSLLSFSFILIYGAIGGLIYVLTVHHRRIQYNQPPAVQPHA